MTTVKTGEWYFGAECPHCGAMAAHAPDPKRGEGDHKPPVPSAPDGKVAVTCPDGHKFETLADNMIRFEWGAQ